jgi:hypothetical protein
MGEELLTGITNWFDYAQNLIRLGQFIEAFEMMVHEVRIDCIWLLSADFPLRRQQLISIPFHHQALSAKPLFDVFRTILMDMIGHDKFRRDYGLTDSDIKNFSGVLSTIAREYDDLANKRNSLLHGTWFVGYRGADDPDASTFHVSKYTPRASGLTKLELPSTASELDALRTLCEEPEHGLVQSITAFQQLGHTMSLGNA